MARTAKGRQLTEAHRQTQASLITALLKILLGLYDTTIDFTRITDSTREFARRAAPVVIRGREASRDMAREYLHDFREVEAPELRGPLVDIPDGYEVEDALEDLWVTARVSLKIESRKSRSPQEAVERGRTVVAAKATRIVADGGRRAIVDEVEKGKGPIGYARVVDADPCAFCAMLASRGVSYTGWADDGVGLYRSDAFKASNSRFKGQGQFKVHDGCQCTLEPVYEGKGRIRLPGRGDELARAWARVAAGQENSFAAWRRWWDSGTLPVDFEGPLAEGEVKRPTPPSRRKKKVQTAAERSGKRFEGVLEDRLEGFLRAAEKRLRGVEAELIEMESLGKTDNEIAVISLMRQRQLLVSRIDTFKDLLG